MRVTTTIDKLPKLLELTNEATFAAVSRGALFGAHRARGILVRATPVDTGKMRAGWTVVAPGLAMRWTGKTTLEVAAVTNDSPYIGIVEKGARPHAVSDEGWFAIYEWVYRHRREFGFVTKTGKVRGAKKSGRDMHARIDTKELDAHLVGITWAICRKIKLRGQAPKYFIRDAIPKVAAAVASEIRRELATMAPPKGAR